ncbi:MAG: hypothetical protein EA359_07685 [Balneolaceae bacterium]|nr:MAG: hypothetical protein EA359_07685 [Balneolaceae bacterium]
MGDLLINKISALYRFVQWIRNPARAAGIKRVTSIQIMYRNPLQLWQELSFASHSARFALSTTFSML